MNTQDFLKGYFFAAFVFATSDIAKRNDNLISQIDITTN